MNEVSWRRILQNAGTDFPDDEPMRQAPYGEMPRARDPRDPRYQQHPRYNEPQEQSLNGLEMELRRALNRAAHQPDARPAPTRNPQQHARASERGEWQRAQPAYAPEQFERRRSQPAPAPEQFERRRSQPAPAPEQFERRRSQPAPAPEQFERRRSQPAPAPEQFERRRSLPAPVPEQFERRRAPAAYAAQAPYRVQLPALYAPPVPPAAEKRRGGIRNIIAISLSAAIVGFAAHEVSAQWTKSRSAAVMRHNKVASVDPAYTGTANGAEPAMAQTYSVQTETASVNESVQSAATAPNAATTDDATGARLTPMEEETLTQKALAHLENGEIASARQILLYLANHRSALAAILLAKTYDARYITAFNVKGLVADQEMARKWYGRAARLGSREAASYLSNTKQ